MKKSPSVIAVVFTTVVAAVAWSSPASSRSLVPAQASPTPNAVIAWNANAGDAALAACISPGNDPLHEARLYAMMHVAIHDALNAIDRTSKPYAYHARNLAEGSFARRRGCLGGSERAPPGDCGTPIPTRVHSRRGRERQRRLPSAALAAIPSGQAKQQGIQLGAAELLRSSN